MLEFEDLNTENFLAELQGRSLQSFSELAKVVFTPLWRFLVVSAGVPEADAEEIAQDTLLKVYDNVGRFRLNGQAKLTSWIFQIARNLAIDFHRVSRPDQHELDKNELPALSGCRFAGRNADYLSKLKDALEMLSDQDQEILLWRSRDIAYAEIAKWHGVKAGTARVRHLRAEKRLKALCGTADHPDEDGVPDVEEAGVA